MPRAEDMTTERLLEISGQLQAGPADFLPALEPTPEQIQGSPQPGNLAAAEDRILGAVGGAIPAVASPSRRSASEMTTEELLQISRGGAARPTGLPRLPAADIESLTRLVRAETSGDFPKLTAQQLVGRLSRRAALGAADVTDVVERAVGVPRSPFKTGEPLTPKQKTRADLLKAIKPVAVLLPSGGSLNVDLSGTVAAGADVARLATRYGMGIAGFVAGLPDRYLNPEDYVERPEATLPFFEGGKQQLQEGEESARAKVFVEDLGGLRQMFGDFLPTVDFLFRTKLLGEKDPSANINRNNPIVRLAEFISGKPMTQENYREVINRFYEAPETPAFVVSMLGGAKNVVKKASEIIADIDAKGITKRAQPLRERGFPEDPGPTELPRLETDPRVNPATAELYRTGNPADALTVNETVLPQKAPFTTRRQLPAVRRDEHAVIRGVPYAEPPTAQPTGRGVVQVAAESLENPIRMYERHGLRKLIYDPIRDAAGTAIRATADVVDGLDAVIKNSIPSRVDKASERIMLFATSQQKGGAAILKQMGRDVPSLTPGEITAYNWMRGQLDIMYKQLNASRRAAGLDPFPQVSNYFTFFRNLEGELARGVDPARADFNRLNKPQTLRAGETRFRFKKKRVLDDYGPLELDAFGVFRRYNQAAQRHIFLTPEIAKARQLIDGKYADGYKFSEENPHAFDQVNDHLNFVAGASPNVSKASAVIGRALTPLRKNLAYAVLSFNLRSAAIQPSAIVNTAVELGPRWALEGVRSLLAGGERQRAMTQSKVLFGRQYDVAITEALNSVTGRFARAKRTAGEIGLKPLKLLDMITAQATWLGAHAKATEVLGLRGREAIGYADNVVTRTQASAFRQDVSPLQRTALGRSASMFQTFVINNWGFLTRDVLGIGNPKITNREAFKKVMTYMAGAQAFNVLFEDGFGAIGLQTRSPFPDPLREFARAVNEDEGVGTALVEAAKEFGQEVPIVGGAARFGDNPYGALAQLGIDWVRVLRGDATLGKTAETLGKTLGVAGTTQIKKTGRFITEEDK